MVHAVTYNGTFTSVVLYYTSSGVWASRTIDRNIAFFPLVVPTSAQLLLTLLHHHSYTVAEKFATYELTLCSARMHIVKLVTRIIMNFSMYQDSVKV